MSLNSFRKSINVSRKVLREEGWRGFALRLLRRGEHALLRGEKSSSPVTQKYRISTDVRYEDALGADYANPKYSWQPTSSKNLVLSWIMPPPGKGSGGHHNIFRFIKYLEDAGHTCRIYITTQGGKGKISEVRALMGSSYPEVKAPMVWIEDGNEIQDSDAVFSTSWQTAYTSFNSSAKGKRFYFVQDFEPWFYPMGSRYILAENTYRFGFFGVTAGGWLAKKLKDEYGMTTASFDFGADKTLYPLKNSKPRKEIFCYVRPYTERRGFELSIMALELFHARHPDYTINLAGWDVSEYSIPFPYNNLKTLELDQLSDLYNSCAAGLVISLTNMSLLPLELLSCGVIPVVNDGPNNRLVSDNEFIRYCPPTPPAIADALSKVIETENLERLAKKAADSVDTSSWENSGKRFVNIIEEEVRRGE